MKYFARCNVKIISSTLFRDIVGCGIQEAAFHSNNGSGSRLTIVLNAAYDMKINTDFS
jgi:hypothetical protein